MGLARYISHTIAKECCYHVTKQQTTADGVIEVGSGGAKGVELEEHL